MSLQLVGLSHHTAQLPLLERVAGTGRDGAALLSDLRRLPGTTEAMMLSTCNRLEIYTVTDDCEHGSKRVLDLLAEHAGVTPAELAQQGFVYRDAAAVQHLLEVAGGLDSLVVGDQQILGQVRAAYASSAAAGAAGPVLHPLAQKALRVGKQITKGTNLAGAGASVVDAALQHVAAALPGNTLAGRRVLVMGAGALGSLAVAQLRRRGVAQVLVANRTPSRAASLASTDSAVRAIAPTDVADELAKADVVIACTAAPGVLSQTQMRAALDWRAANPGSDHAPLVLCDLGLPRNIDPCVGVLPGVLLVDLDTLRAPVAKENVHVVAARRIVTDHVEAWSERQRTADALPTVVRLRENGQAVVDAELARLHSRLPNLDTVTRQEVTRAAQRIAEKLLHAPTLALRTTGPALAVPAPDTSAALRAVS